MTPEEEGLVARLADEYKILQDKIDKIGGFRVTIKGWSITVIIAALFAGSATNSLSPALSLPSLIVLIVAFFFFEREQTGLSRRFGQRLIAIESVVSRILRRDARKSGSHDFVLLRYVPGIAHHLAHEHLRPKGPRSRWRSLHDAHIEFYVVEAILVCAVVVGHALSKPSDNEVVIKGGQLTIVQAPERHIDPPIEGKTNRDVHPTAGGRQATDSDRKNSPGNAALQAAPKHNDNSKKTPK